MPRKPKSPPPPPIEFDPYTDKPVPDETGSPTALTIPVQSGSRLTRDPGRGMMPPTGPQDPVYAKYLTSLDLDELKTALAQDSSPKVIAFLAALVDPRQKDADITTLAKHHSIGLTEMMQVWRSYKLTHAMGVHIDAAPAIALDVTLDARSIIICCPRCDGAGLIRVTRHDLAEWIDCPQCSATGAVRKVGDSKSRDLVYQTIGFTKAGGFTVNNNIQNNSSTVESVLDELERLPPVISVSSIALPADDA